MLRRLLKQYPKVVQEPDQRFIFHLAEMFQRLPSDPWFDDIDPIEKMYLFYSWQEKERRQMEMMRDQAILIGSFTNLEMAKDMVKPPDFESSEEEYEDSWSYVQSQPVSDAAKRELQGIQGEGDLRLSRRRKRRVVE